MPGAFIIDYPENQFHGDLNKISPQDLLMGEICNCWKHGAREASPPYVCIWENRTQPHGSHSESPSLDNKKNKKKNGEGKMENYRENRLLECGVVYTMR
jgi:hypothetical protein